VLVIWLDRDQPFAVAQSVRALHEISTEKGWHDHGVLVRQHAIVSQAHLAWNQLFHGSAPDKLHPQLLEEEPQHLFTTAQSANSEMSGKGLRRNKGDGCFLVQAFSQP
jgi:hypothetical protein